jgi:hypothetical protein
MPYCLATLLHCKPIPVMKTGFSLCSFSHREKPVYINSVPCNENRFFPVWKNYRENPVLALPFVVYTLVLFYKQHMIKKVSWTFLDFIQSLLIFVAYLVLLRKCIVVALEKIKTSIFCGF